MHYTTTEAKIEIQKQFNLDETQAQNVIDVLTKNEDMSDDVYSVMYDHFISEMPYGTAKARTGDPIEWICDRLAMDYPLEATT